MRRIFVVSQAIILLILAGCADHQSGIAGQDRKKAEQLFNEYITILGANADANPNAWYYRGQLYKDTNRAADAKVDLQKAAGMGSKEAAKLLATMK